MKENAYLICKVAENGVYVPQTGPIVLTGGDLAFDDLLALAKSLNCIVVLLSAK